jgi:DNA-binding beta-propeller fold protein YncE
VYKGIVDAKAARSARTLLLYLLPALAWGAGCHKKTEATTAGADVGIDPRRAAYVTDNGSDALSVFDRDGDKVVQVPIDLDRSAHEAPHHLAVDPVAGRAFVALAFPPAPPAEAKKDDPHAGHGAAERRGKMAVLDLVRLAVHDVREVDENPGDIVLTHDRAHVLVTHYDMKRAMDVAAAGGATSKMFAALQVWDARSLTLIGSRPLCVAPHGVVTTRDDRTAFVACYGSDELAVVDLTNAQLPTSRYPLGASPGAPGVPTYGPYSATLTPDETRVAVADLEGMDVRVFDRQKKGFLLDREVSLGARAFMPAFVDAKTLVVPLQAPDGIAKVDLDEGVVTARVATGASAGGACVAPHVARVAKDGRLYVVCEGDHVRPGAVVQVRPDSLEIVKRWTVGVYPDAVAFGEP